METDTREAAIEVLRKARAFLGEGEHRWAREQQVVRRAGDGTIIAACAGIACSRDGYSNPEAFTMALRCLRATVAPTDGIFDWNDHPDRTYAEVLAGFDAAIENMERFDLVPL